MPVSTPCRDYPRVAEYDAITFKVGAGFSRGEATNSLHSTAPPCHLTAIHQLVRSLCHPSVCSCMCVQQFVESQTDDINGRNLMYWLYCDANGGYNPASVRLGGRRTLCCLRPARCAK